MKKTVFLLFLLLAVCASLFAVTYAEGKTLDVYPDTVLSGNKFAIQFEPNKKSATITQYGSAKTLMVMGDKTGTSELKIGTGGSVDYASIVKLFESNTEIYMILSSDKDYVAKAKFSLIVGSDFMARLSKNESAQYHIHGLGPAGGVIIYDKGEYSDGWRYLEAAPSDLRVVAGSPSVDSSDPWYAFGDEKVIFGLYRNSPDGKNLYVNGNDRYNEKDCTGTAIGTGKKNTEMLVEAMGDSAYSGEFGSYKSSTYAAKLCYDLVYNGFDDWFLPSKDELDLMYISGDNKSYYWSSSEYNEDAEVAWLQHYYTCFQYHHYRHYEYRVRPIRAF